MTKLLMDGQGSLQGQICAGLRQLILDGGLAAGSRLPPSRVFAEEYRVSRNTVLAAYDQLSAEGYLETRPGAGTFVTAEPLAIGNGQEMPGDVAKTPLVPRWSEQAERLMNKVPEGLVTRGKRTRLRYDFLYGEPGYDDLPLDRWARIIGRCARELTESQLGYGPVDGLFDLRLALSGYLARARGVQCDPEQIFIVQGTQEGIDLSVRALVDAGDVAVLEEPHYRGFKRCLLAAGAEIKTVPVNEAGIETKSLTNITDAKLAFVTPSHQFPFGSVMSLSRRGQLLDWASRNNTVILEDDYDGEFRYEGRPIPSLQSLDDSGSVIYLGTTSKMLFPSLRLGWMVVPKPMLPTFKRLKALSDSGVSVLEQLALGEFINQGYLERHIHKVRKAHQTRRETLLEAIHRELGDLVEVTGSQAGIHILLRVKHLKRGKTDELVQLALEQEVGVYSADIYYSKPSKNLELLLGYAALTPAQIEEGIKRLAKLIRKL